MLLFRLPTNADDTSFRKLFSLYGEITSTKLLVGHGFVKFRHRKDAIKAKKNLDETLYKGVMMKVCFDTMICFF